MQKPRALLLGLAALLIAITTVFTLLVRLPIPGTSGYVNFSDVATYFAGLAFGPWMGLIAGGVGTAIADLLGGYAQFSLLSFLAHGAQGFLAGWLGRGKGLPGLALAWAVGAVAMVAIYFVGEGLVLYGGWAPALAEVPFNIAQTVVGGLIGVPLFYAVRRAYPPLERLGKPVRWEER